MDTDSSETRVFDFGSLPMCAWEGDDPGPSYGCSEFDPESGTIGCTAQSTVVVDITEHVYHDGIDRVAFCRTHADVVLTDAHGDPTCSAHEVHDTAVNW